MSKAADFRAGARRSLSGYWGVSILVCFVALLLGGLSSGTSFSYNYDNLDFGTFGEIWRLIAVPVMLYSFVTFLLGGAIELGVCSYFCRLNLGERPEFGSLFDKLNIFMKALGLRLFMTLFITLWSFLFVIPGIIAAYRYSMAPYLMAERPDMGIREAVNRSKDLMEDNNWRLFCLHISFFGWSLLSLLTLGIASLWINPYVEAASAAFYLELTGRPYGMPGASEGQA